MDMQMVPEQVPVQTTRADLVAILEELHDVLLKIDADEIERRYVDFAALAGRLQEVIDTVQDLPPGTVCSGDEERPAYRA